MSTTVLATIESTDLAGFFTDVVTDEFLERIEEEARSIIPDTSTAKGRQAIGSLANKIAKGKVMIDNAGKELVSEWKTKANVIDVERKVIRERLDALKVEIRQPLTEWEEEQAVIKAAEELKKEIAEAYASAVIENDLFDTKRELERWRLEAIELERRRATEEAERKEAERIRAEQRAKEAAETAEREKQEAIELERRRATEEAERKEAERIRAEQRAREAKEREEESRRKLAAKKAHVEKINHEAAEDISFRIDVEKDVAEDVIRFIADGEVRHVEIRYTDGLEGK